MPIYEYACGVCGHELEVLQSIKENPLTNCPACNESGLRKKLSAAAFHLKGTGWYETDFKNKKTDDKESQKSDSSETKTADKSKSASEKKDSSKKSSDSDSSSKSSATAT